MLLELDLLKTVVAIAETGTFAKAAESTHRTPSAVSMQVKRLESLTGRPLFLRDARRVRLTPDGEALLDHAREMLNANQKMVDFFHSPTVAGTVRLGAPDDISERFLPEILRAFYQRYPAVSVDVTIDRSVAMADMVDNHALDLALLTCSGGIRLEAMQEVVLREQLTWAGHRNGAVYTKRPLPISVWGEGCVWRRAGITSLEDAGIDYRIAFTSAHLSGQRAVLQTDLAIAPIPLSACDAEIVPLGEDAGLPPLGSYDLALYIGDEPSAPAEAAAGFIRDAMQTL